jgi:hypothetical protein
MVPPAPVIRTRRPATSSLTAVRLRASWGRPQFGAVVGRRVLKLGEPRQASDAQPERVGLLEQSLLVGAIERRRVGHDHPLRAETALGEQSDHDRQIVQTAEHRNAVNRPTLHRGGLIEHADDAVELRRIAPGRANELLGGVPGPEQQDRNGLAVATPRPACRGAVAQQPVGEAGTAEQHDEQAPLDHRYGARHLLQAIEQEHDRKEDQDRQRNRLGDVDQIVDRSIPPDAAIHAEEEKGRYRDRDEGADHHRERLPVDGECRIAKAEIEGEPHGRRRDT